MQVSPPTLITQQHTPSLVWTCIPFSANELHGIARNRKILSKAYRAYKKDMGKELFQQFIALPILPRLDPTLRLAISIELTVHRTLKGGYRRIDVDNTLKAALDVAFAAYNEAGLVRWGVSFLPIDDSQIDTVTIQRRWIGNRSGYKGHMALDLHVI